MKKMIFRTLGLSLLSVLVSEAVVADTRRYNEPGTIGSPKSWMTSEFTNQWGLAAINAHHAYAQGYTGKGVAIGVIDSQVLGNHPKLAGKHSDLSPGQYDIDEYDDGTYYYEDHGTHVAGIAAAHRNGDSMHGVAFDAMLVTGTLDGGEKLEPLTQNDVRIINNSWGFENPKNADELNILFQQMNQQQIEKLSQSPIGANSTIHPDDIAKAGMLRAARNGKLIVFAAGNEGNSTIPGTIESLPHLFPEIVENYLVVTNYDNSGSLNLGSTRCGPTASFCVAAPGTDIWSTAGTFAENASEGAILAGTAEIDSGYKQYTGTSMAAPHVSGAAAIVMQRFPYMTAGQISAVLKTTANQDSDARINEKNGWGFIDLKQAMDGPKMFITKDDIPDELYVPGSYTDEYFVVRQGTDVIIDEGTPLARQCVGPECASDIWKNDITGHGGLQKLGNGILTLAGNSTYQGNTLVEQGQLAVTGAITSDVTVSGSGILGGNGRVGSLAAGQGGTVAPGAGTLTVSRNITFDPDSLYRVTVAGPQSSNLHAEQAQLNGGEVTVTLDSSKNLLASKQIVSVLGKQEILSATQGVAGQFTAVNAHNKFVDTQLDYQANHVSLEVFRNNKTFASMAQTDNERAVASALDRLQAGNPVLESLITFNGSEDDNRQAYRQLSGQIHADAMSAQMSESRLLRDTLNSRLRQTQGLSGDTELKADDNGAWAKLIGAWGRMAADANATGYRTSTYGVLLGGDSAIGADSHLGIATGFTRTSLKGGYAGSAKINNFPLALYGGTQWGSTSLRAGLANTWHQIETSRTVAYGPHSDRPEAKYSASTRQIFTELGYQVYNGENALLEPFVNLAGVQTEAHGFREKGGAAALKGNSQKRNSAFSTTGIRAEKRWQTGKNMTTSINSELGWQHAFGKIKDNANLKFNDDAAFSVSSAAAARDNAVVKIGTEVKVADKTSLSLGYSGELSSRTQNNSINAGFSWRF